MLYDFVRGHFTSAHGAQHTAFRKIAVSQRANNFADFFDDLLHLHTTARLIRAGRDILADQSIESSDHMSAIRSFAIDKCNTPALPAMSIEELTQLTYEAARRSDRRIPQSHYHAVLEECKKGVFACYMCGASLDPGAKPGTQRFLTLDHLWSKAHGGDSIAANLLPACNWCNQAKGSMLGWQWVLVHATLAGLTISVGQITKEVKIALHARAASALAERDSITLKEAYLHLGAREEVAKMDPDDTGDFFNLLAHDSARHNLYWMTG